MQWSSQLGVHIKANLVLELYYLMPIITLLGHHTEIYTRKKENHNSTICHVLLFLNFIDYILKIRCMKQAQWAFENVLRGQNGDLLDIFYWNFKELYCMTTQIVQKYQWHHLAVIIYYVSIHVDPNDINPIFLLVQIQLERLLVGSLVGKLYSSFCFVRYDLPTNSLTNDSTNNRTNWICTSKKIGLYSSFSWIKLHMTLKKTSNPTIHPHPRWV
jgi:hypothetical protein